MAPSPSTVIDLTTEDDQDDYYNRDSKGRYVPGRRKLLKFPRRYLGVSCSEREDEQDVEDVEDPNFSERARRVRQTRKPNPALAKLQTRAQRSPTLGAALEHANKRERDKDQDGGLEKRSRHLRAARKTVPFQSPDSVAGPGTDGEEFSMASTAQGNKGKGRADDLTLANGVVKTTPLTSPISARKPLAKFRAWHRPTPSDPEFAKRYRESFYDPRYFPNPINAQYDRPFLLRNIRRILSMTFLSPSSSGAMISPRMGVSFRGPIYSLEERLEQEEWMDLARVHHMLQCDISRIELSATYGLLGEFNMRYARLQLLHLVNNRWETLLMVHPRFEGPQLENPVTDSIMLPYAYPEIKCKFVLDHVLDRDYRCPFEQGGSADESLAWHSEDFLVVDQRFCKLPSTITLRRKGHGLRDHRFIMENPLLWAFNQRLKPIPETIRKPPLAHVRLIYLPFNKGDGTLPAASYVTPNLTGWFCALCKLGDCGSARALRHHFLTSHAGEAVLGAFSFARQIPHSQTMPDIAVQENSPDITHVTVSLRLLDPDKPLDQSSISCTTPKQGDRSHEQPVAVPKRRLASLSDLPPSATAAVAAIAIPVIDKLVHKDLADGDEYKDGRNNRGDSQDSECTDDGNLTVLTAWHERTISDVPNHNAQSIPASTDEIVVKEERIDGRTWGVRDPQQYVQLSSWVVPGTKMDLMRQLDVYYDGGMSRFVMQETEAIIWTQHHLTDKMRLFSCIWNRWRWEHGPIQRLNADSYMRFFLLKYFKLLKAGELSEEFENFVLLFLLEHRLISRELAIGIINLYQRIERASGS